MRKLASAFAVALLLSLGTLRGSPAPVDATHVVVLANSEDPDSRSVAEHYAEVRGIPQGNILAFPMALSETISWREFVETIWQPVQDELVRRGLIDALLMEGRDPVGRKQYAISGHSIAALVVCRGVPLRVSGDPSLLREYPPFTQSPQLRTTEGAVDSELSLLPYAGYPISAFVPNPLFRNERPSELDRARVVIVGRLDGPSAADACALVDNAVLGERTGLLGRAYVDLGGPHAEGDVWLEATAKLVESLGFDLSVDRSPTTIPASARFDAPVLYFGWYAADVTGPFLLPGFRFPPGAVAMHIHSFSAHTVRSAEKAWCGPLIARGVTATVGNVYEPYLEFTHRPDLLLRALASGRSMGEAAYFALPCLSWQAILVGDPLYRPFSRARKALAGEGDRPAAGLADYDAVRSAVLLLRDGRRTEAIGLLRARLDRVPSMPVALFLGEQLAKSGDRAGAAQAMQGALGSGGYDPTQWGLAHAFAEELSACGDHRSALNVYVRLMAAAGMERSVRMPLLADAEAEAIRAGDRAAASRWKSELDELVSKVLTNT